MDAGPLFRRSAILVRIKVRVSIAYVRNSGPSEYWIFGIADRNPAAWHVTLSGSLVIPSTAVMNLDAEK